LVLAPTVLLLGILILVTTGPFIGINVGTTVLWEAIDREKEAMVPKDTKSMNTDDQHVQQISDILEGTGEDSDEGDSSQTGTGGE